LALGVLLLAVPTGFAIFPHWGRWPLDARELIMIGWVLIAALAGWLTITADRDLHAAVQAEREQIIRAERRAALADHLRVLLAPGANGIPERYIFTLYGPSPDGEFLIPLYPPALSVEDTAIFQVGSGATGKAWASPDDGTFVVLGEAVWTAVHGLTDAQSDRYRPFEVVAATVVFDADDNPIGVLTALAREDEGFFEAGDGIAALEELADSVAWIVPEAVRWMPPTGEEVSDDTSGA
jgi:hypothetical protein